MALGFLNNKKPKSSDGISVNVDLVTVNDEMNAFMVHVFDGSKEKYLSSEWYQVEGGDAQISSI